MEWVRIVSVGVEAGAEDARGQGGFGQEWCLTRGPGRERGEAVGWGCIGMGSRVEFAAPTH
jgi:hypothetical protein